MVLKTHIEANFHALWLHNKALHHLIQITLFQDTATALGPTQLIIEEPTQTISFPVIEIPELASMVQYPVPELYGNINWTAWKKINEALSSQLILKVVHGKEEVATKQVPITLHPIDSFPGQAAIKYLPSFVFPNHPYCYQIKQKTIPTLQSLKYQTAFEGYQSNSKSRVLEQITALFYTLREEKWVYSSLPASYEQEGQRLRLMDSVQQLKFGNCIDLSLTIASLLEAMDLHPIIVLIPGHAFVGCWLVPQTFDTPVISHKNELTQRIAKGIQDMVLFEATSVCLGQNSSFKDATADGESLIIGSQNFTAAIDIKMSRIIGVKPFPINDNEVLSQPDHNIGAQKAKIETVTITDAAPLDLQQLKGKELNKQQVWERKLLDLTLRNSLLHLKLSNNTIQLVNIPFDSLFQKLWSGKSFTITNCAALNIEVDRRSLIDTLHQKEQLFQFAAHELNQHRLLSVYSEHDMMHTLSHILRSNQSAIDESGTASLYIAMGVLKWRDANTPNTERLAPLLLLPVDLKRNSILSKFHIKLREEELQLNTTLIHFLQQEYQLNLAALSDYMEEQEEQIDLQVIFNTIRKAVAQHRDWEIDELLFLSNFNFKTQVLWNDIHENMPLMIDHPIINGLINTNYNIGFKEDKEENIHQYDVQKHITPITADSSQLAAIMAANEGESFVLHGPPGTGKSQTITNIIANFLYHNKTVLFVAAKKAALDVVHNRLVQIGLKDFALELHSNKAKKSDVLLHFEKTLSQSKLKPDGAFIETAVHYTQQRKQIELSLQAVHTKQACGMSIFQLINELVQQHPNYQDRIKINFSTHQLQSLHSQQVQKWLEWIQQMEHDPLLQLDNQYHPLSSLSEIDYVLGLEQRINQIKLNNINSLNNNLNNFKLNTNNQLNIKISSLNTLADFLKKIDTNRDIPIKLLTHEFVRNIQDYIQVITTQEEQKNIEESITKEYNSNILEIAIESIKKEWILSQSKWFLPKYFGNRKVIKLLQKYSQHQDYNQATIHTILNKIEQYQLLKNTLNNNNNKLLINNLGYLDLKLDIKEKIYKYKEEVQGLLSLMEDIGLRQHVYDLVANKDTQHTLHDLFQDLKLEQTIAEQWKELKEDTLFFLNHFQTEKTIEHLDDFLHTLQLVQENQHEIATWHQYLQLEKQWHSLGLNNTLQSIKNKEYSTNNLYHNFKYSLYEALLHYYVQQHSQLRSFNGLKMEQMLAQFNELQVRYNEYCKRETYLLKNKELPNLQYAAVDQSELTTLQRAIRSKGRGWSIRNLFQRIPHTLPRIAPCMLMSPISVAQFLAMDLPAFDLVIFDEASQLPTSEAVSAIARAQQVIVVGDPKQMPPTSFFATQTTEEEAHELEDLESILDDTLSINLPSRYLLRHYRSQHESLISFSNQSFYHGQLFTFPSADDLNSKVSWTHVPGYYDKGNTRQNIFEATAIVKEIQQLLLQNTNKTIGIVTFSQTQQSLIIDLIDELYCQYPDLEQKAAQLAEPIFVKNLENVQGDERDIILFSIGYAADKNGVLSMNFGPLNKEGGWRRLNVAITRAKHEMKVFSTLRPEEIDLNKTQAIGVQSLQAFLKFAQQQNYKSRQAASREAIHPILLALQEVLTSHGYQTQTLIGQAQFKIDLGVLHPKYPQQYIIGIILDGPEFTAIGNLQDRYHIIPQVLNHLQWHIFHIWTLDWQFNAQQVTEKLLSKLKELEEQEDFIPAYATTVAPNITPFQPEAIADLIILEEDILDNYRTNYEYTQIAPVQQSGSEAFLHSSNREIVKNQILKLVHTEAPISGSFLSKRLLTIWGMTRSGARIERYIQEQIQALGCLQEHLGEEYYIWRPGAATNQLSQYRIPTEGNKRSGTDIAPQEWALCLKAALIQHKSLPKLAAFKYLQKTLLTSRYNISLNEEIEKGLSLVAADYGLVVTDQDFKLLN